MAKFLVPSVEKTLTDGAEIKLLDLAKCCSKFIFILISVSKN